MPALQPTPLPAPMAVSQLIPHWLDQHQSIRGSTARGEQSSWLKCLPVIWKTSAGLFAITGHSVTTI